MAKESAEEKLLKMMQKPSGSVGDKPAGDLAKTTAGAAKPAAPKKKISFSVSIAAINIILFLGILICIAALVWEMRSGFALLNQSVEFPVESKTSVSLSDIALPSAQSADYYLQKVNERNIFKPFVPKVVAKAAAHGLAAEMNKYRLVGISWLDLPETASIMIEDKEKKQTFFLKQGEQLDGVTVKTIYTDRVVFSHENEETTIKL